MEIPRVALPTGDYRVPTLDEENAAPRLATDDEAVSASYDLAHEDTIVGSLERIAAKDGFLGIGAALDQNGSKLSPDEANKRYPGMPEPFREEITPSYAQFRFDQEQERSKLRQAVDSGPSGLLQKTQVTGAGLMAHLMDPTEVAVGWAAGAAVGAAVGGSTLVAGAADLAVAGSRVARIGLSTLEAGTGAAIESVAQETASGTAKVAEGEDYDLHQGLENVAIGTALGAGLGVVVKEGIGAFTGVNAWEHMTTAARAERAAAKAARGAVEVVDVVPEFERNIYGEFSPRAAKVADDHVMSAMLTDKPPRVEALTTALIHEADVNPKIFGQPDYVYEPVTSTTGKRFFIAAENQTPTLEGASIKPVGEDLGMGLQMTDNPGVANATSASSMSEQVGHVHEVTFTREPKLLRESDVIPEALAENTRKLMNEIGEEFDNMDVGKVVKAIRDAEAAELLPPGSSKFYGEELRKAGYDAIVGDGSSRFGIDVAPHNKLTVLADDLIAHKAAFEAEPKFINQPTPKDLDAMRDYHLGEHPSSNIDEANMAKVQAEFEAKRAEISTSTDQKAMLDQHLEDFQALDELGDEMSPQDYAEYQAIKEQAAGLDSTHKFRLMTAKCMGA